MKLRNIAIIAHVDHGKTTLVDKLLKQSQTLADREELQERAMDSNPQERERGITILAKNTAIRWNDYRINIVDTPGHADFGGEVERVLSMVDSVLLLVDAVDGPMPQTRFVTRKAFDHGLRPIVVINKVDRDGARPHLAVERTFDLMDSLGASNEQLDFPNVLVMEGPAEEGGRSTKGRVNQLLTFKGLERVVSRSAGPGDIVLINGIEDIGIGVTITSLDNPSPLPMLRIDEPTLTMNFCVNTSPLAGREGKYVTSRQIWDRLQKELQSNVALRVKDTGRGRHLRGLRPGRAAPDHPAGEHAPRRLRAGGEQAARGLSRDRRPEVRADRAGHRRYRDAAPGRRDAGPGRAQGRARQHGADGHGRVRLEYRIPAAA
jgi:GTP-binding protein